MQSLLEAMSSGEISGEPVLALTNVAGAQGLQRAEGFGVPTACIPHTEYRKRRRAHEEAVVQALKDAKADVICLAGYMRLLSSWFVEQFPMQILNIHPSLLPAFPGLDAQRQALEYGVRATGCTVHFVDGKMDNGPIIVQAAVPVLVDDDESALSARILAKEHEIYPLALKWVCDDRVRIEGRRVIVEGAAYSAIEGKTSPVNR